MDLNLNRLKNYLTINKAILPTYQNVEPQIGFKVSFSEEKKELTVKVIGAKQLPTLCGSSKPCGYLVKVTVFPEKEKFETKRVKESWPTINEEFIFTLDSRLNKSKDLFKGKFVSFTIYAVMTENEETSKPKSTNKLRKFFSFNESDVTIRKVDRSSSRTQRFSLSNRRTLGAATYNLDSKNFTQKVRDDCVSTPDIWRGIKEISSGVSTQPREGKKGNVEVTLQYGISEDRTNDVVEVSVNKFRCNLQTMQEHEKIGGQLYIKITAFECEDLIQKMKSDKFEPTISLKIEQNSATLRATVNKYNVEQVKILIRLFCKTTLGKKNLLGKIEIDRNSDIWKKIVEAPSVPVTRIINFE